MKIETERLFLREMTEADYDILYTVFADSDIMQHYPYTFDAARVKNWIAKNRERYRVFGFGLWAVWLKENDKMIGDCGLTMQNIDGTILPEIGYHIAKSHQRNGYAAQSRVIQAPLPLFRTAPRLHHRSVAVALFRHSRTECLPRF